MWHVLILCACVGQTNAAKAGDADMMAQIENLNKEKNSGGLMDVIANIEKNDKASNKNNPTRNAGRLEDSDIPGDFEEAIASGEDEAVVNEAEKKEQGGEMGQMEQGGEAIEAEKGDKIG